jgi:hypothetical protein
MVDHPVSFHLLRDFACLEQIPITWRPEHIDPNTINTIQVKRLGIGLEVAQIPSVLAALFEVIQRISDCSRAGIVAVLAETKERGDAFEGLRRGGRQRAIECGF